VITVARALLLASVVLAGGCVTEAEHIHPTTLPNGKPGYVIICNSQRYDRCLSRAAKACGGAYTIIPQHRDTLRAGDPVAGFGNSESIVVSCGAAEDAQK
jgi:hypothetical protein